MARLMKINSVLKNIFMDEEGTLPFDKFDESLTPNLRALRLSMSMADALLSMDVAASDVVDMTLGVTDTYCKRKVQIEIVSTLLMFSQDRGDDREPLTLIRAVGSRDVNMRQIQRIQELIRSIHKGKLTLEQAEKKFDYIMDHPERYPLWLRTIGNALISAGVGMLVTASPIIVVIMFLAGALTDNIVRIMSKRRMPAFFVQIVAACFITMIAGLVAWLSHEGIAPILNDVDPNYIVVGGIIMLAAGMTVVGAVQDAIDEYYITANARLLGVVMMTAGIVVGVVIGVYIMRTLGIWMDLSPTSSSRIDLPLQYTGATLLAAGYAIGRHATMLGVVLSGLIGFITYASFLALNMGSLSAIAASGVAAAIAGALATLSSRVSRIPSIVLASAGIITLVPGLTLFNGLMGIFVDSNSWTIDNTGSALLLKALFIALSVAGGVSFGILFTRPLRRTLTRAKRVLPRRKLQG
ncbi:threonine/serine exporter family protein [Candidatus Nomurabacteria bacterium]|nr:threonine/serine exporter family protein [Candidatus Nomurabacteria bacterium]